MPHWIAIGTQPHWQDAPAFRASLADSSRWRPTARTAVTAVMLLDDGRFLAEAHGPSLDEFQAWLKASGCEIESCRQALRVARAGNIWELG